MLRLAWWMCALLCSDALAGDAFDALTASDDWKPLTSRRSDYGDIAVSMKYLGHVPCIRAEVDLPITPQELLGVVVDVEGMLGWGDDALVDSEIVYVRDDAPAWYQRAEMPAWSFLHDRVWFMASTITRGEDTLRITWRPAQGAEMDAVRARVKAAHPKAVEPPVNYGQWTAHATPAGLSGRYEICVDGGGAIPLALQRAITTRTLPDGMDDLVREAQRRRGTSSP
jgi:hypothetical protein